MEVRVFALDESIRFDLEELMFQLSGTRRTLTLENHPNVHSIGAFEGTRLVGFAQLFILPKTTFAAAHLEDVVVHEGYRGKGLGRSLVEEAVTIARREGASVMDLTTRPERVAARGLYTSLGFEKPETGLFRLRLS